MVACDDAVFEPHRALLEALSSKLFRIGTKPGDGARTKLVNNLLAAINLAGACEVMACRRRRFPVLVGRRARAVAGGDRTVGGQLSTSLQLAAMYA